MTRAVRAFFAGVLWIQGCGPHAAGIPKGPPPEYEKPPLPPWDAGGKPAEPRKTQLPAGDAGPMSH